MTIGVKLYPSPELAIDTIDSWPLLVVPTPTVAVRIPATVSFGSLNVTPGWYVYAWPESIIVTCPTSISSGGAFKAHVAVAVVAAPGADIVTPPISV